MKYLDLSKAYVVLCKFYQKSKNYGESQKLRKITEKY